MHNYIEYFNTLPVWLIIALMAIFGLMQGIGELLEFKGKVVPEIMKVRKGFARRKKERETLSKMTELIPLLEKMPSVLEDAVTSINTVNQHYNNDNITMRNNWIKNVDSNIDEMRSWMKKLDTKLDKNNKDTLDIKIENIRSTIIDFAKYIGDETKPVTKEQFDRIFNLYQKYEKILADNGLTNGQVDIAMKIINKSCEEHLRNHSFIEDTYGYNN